MEQNTLSSLMILVCAVALIILLSLVVYTWVKWHMNEVQQATTSNETPGVNPAIETTSFTSHYPQTHFQQGYLNTAGRDSPNLSGSRTFLNEDVLKQKPFPKDANPPPPAFETEDVVYHANAERDPSELKSGDIVFHANRPFGDRQTTDGLQAGHVVYNTEKTNGRRRWTESMVPGEYSRPFGARKEGRKMRDPGSEVA